MFSLDVFEMMICLNDLNIVVERTFIELTSKQFAYFVRVANPRMTQLSTVGYRCFTIK